MTSDQDDFFRPIWSDFDGELFQDLVADLLHADGYRVQKSGVGPDGGVDLFAEQDIIYGYSNAESFVWAVQCKFSADSKTTISPSKVGEILNSVGDERFSHKHISGFFLVTNVRLSTNMMGQLNGLKNRIPGFKSTYWDRAAIHDVLGRHFKIYAKYFSRPTDDPIAQLEDMIRSSNSKEADFAAFFQTNPQLIAKALGTGRTVLVQVDLRETDGRSMRPDFLLSPRGTEPWTILELKRPDTPVISRPRPHRTRFSLAIQEARAQLQLYQRFFDTPENRQQVRTVVDAEVYRPRLVLFAGRDYGDLSHNEIIRLKSELDDIRIITYMELLELLKEHD